MTIRLAIINDYEVVVRGLADMLRSSTDQIEVVELDVQVPVAERVDIALYDTFAQGQGDSPAVVELLENPHVDKVVVYSWNHDALVVRRALAMGVSAYLSKTMAADELVNALRAVHAGETLAPPAAVDRPLQQQEWPGRREGLTPREAEVIALITRGYSNADIAEMASLSINSVKSYIRSSYRKMGVTSRTNAVLWGLEHGMGGSTRARIQPDQDD
jgi:two-component system, NarL family, response regulator LiaR